MDRLPVKDFVQILILNLEGDVMGWKDFFLEVVRQAILFGSEAGPGIKVSFIF